MSTARAVHQTIRTYLTERVARGELVASSAEVIDSVLRSWARHVHYRPPRQWTEREVTTWVFAPDVRATTSKSRLTKLRPFVRWLIDHGHLDVDITRAVGRVKVPRPTPRDLTVEEVRRLLAVCPDDRARLIVTLMVQLGLRCGDVARMRVEDIDARRRQVAIRGKGGRGEVTHWVPIPAEAWDTLISYLTERGKVSGPVVRSTQRPDRGLDPHTISKMVGRWIRAAGLKSLPYDGISAHSLRHTTAQHMVDRGADLREVQHVLGHRSVTTTEQYVRHEPPGLRAAVDGRRYAA